ncbi:MAG TPA: imidazole glycerol phosphate synthase subunit HisH [Chitinophagaceae bacterium]|nr:imidazole glycerol phosphate synthase subunit HisH [Chitinophagaceae bacterium]
MGERIVIVKYNAGNIQSVLYALERIGEQAVVTDDHEQIRQADKVIFPGVGEASSAMAYLKERGLDQVLKELKQPVLGICLGMQLMCRHSEENDTECLGIFDEPVIRFVAGDSGMKIPQIGWNRVVETSSPLFKGINDGSYFYFVHSYYAARGAHTIGVADYIQPYSAALHQGNFYGVQFHPEKSAVAGEQLLRNFLSF